MIVRHAKSSWDDQLVSDIERPLNKRGTKDALSIASWLKGKNYMPDQLLSSTALRAKQTTEAIVNVLGLSGDKLIYLPKLYLATPETLLDIIHACSNQFFSLMLVGHNPGMEDLTKQLCRDTLPYTSDGKLLTTANFVLLEFPQKWKDVSSQNGKLIEFFRPKQLT